MTRSPIILSLDSCFGRLLHTQLVLGSCFRIYSPCCRPRPAPARSSSSEQTEQTFRYVSLNTSMFKFSTMPLHITHLPIELLLEITRNVIPKEDLCQLRIVNSLVETLATPKIFNSITVRNNEQSATDFGPYSEHLASLYISTPFRSSRVRRANDMHLLRHCRWH